MQNKQNFEQAIDEQIRIVVSSLEPEKGPIRVRVAEPPAPDPGIKLKVGLDPDTKIRLKIKEPIKVYLKIRSTLSGDYIIYDHPLYDIVIMPAKNKIVTFGRDDAQIDPYPSQNKFFNFLRFKGIILSDTIQAGSVYGSLEGMYPVNDDVDTIEIILLAVYDFVKKETPEIMTALDYEMTVEDEYSDPSEEDTTELGEVPHADKKGTIDPSYKIHQIIYRI
tara:strand:- start:1176 stop:1838 length:663 start_codon:yes stop_codon:yes gene_type:complete